MSSFDAASIIVSANRVHANAFVTPNEIAIGTGIEIEIGIEIVNRWNLATTVGRAVSIDNSVAWIYEKVCNAISIAISMDPKSNIRVEAKS